jgi:diguanylate cyclase (GGDEF)-like protein
MPQKTYRDDFKGLSRVALGLIALFVLATGLTIWGLRSDAIRDADNDTGNIAVVLSGQIARSIQSVDIILSDVRDQANAAGQQTPGETARRIHGHDFYGLLLSHLNRLSQADVIALIDHTGRVANSTTQWPPTGTDVSDRDYFQHFSNESDDGIFISSLLRNRISGERMVFFSKRINGPDREFLGVVLIGLRLSYFETIYKSISPLRDQTFALLHSDGTVLVRYPDDIDRDDQRMPAGSPWYKLSASGGGNYRSPGYFDGDARFVSVRPLQDYPLVVDVAVTETAALTNWYRRATLIGAGSLLALICWTLLLRLSGKQFQRLFESETKLKRLAHYDNLTGLANRVSLHNDLNEVIRANRGPTAIAIFDLDGFKDVNDTLGHSTGDILLREVARRLSEFVADGGRFYRLGGDEFVLVKTACGDPIEIVGIVGSVLRRLAEKFEISGHQLFVGASAGIAMAPADGDDIEELVSNADLALYDAKSAGGNTCRLFLPVMRARTIARRELDVELRRASANRDFELFFQPQVRTSDGAVIGAEALLRWRHPQRGILAPGAFIEALSESPVVLEVGRWILQSACKQAAAWRQAGFPLRIGVNLFSAQFHGETLIADVEAALSHSGLPPDALEIEITENIALGEQEESLQALHTLRAKGVKLAFDDFGTGYASLSYLARYPLTRIKIDQSFVRKIAGAFTLADTAIVRSIIVMAHHLGLEVIAEGVETLAQVAFLRAEKCEELQGYLYAKPLSAADFEAYLRTDRSRACDEDLMRGLGHASDEFGIAKLA